MDENSARNAEIAGSVIGYKEWADHVYHIISNKGE
jgi:hypothetical protein